MSDWILNLWIHQYVHTLKYLLIETNVFKILQIPLVTLSSLTIWYYHNTTHKRNLSIPSSICYNLFDYMNKQKIALIVIILMLWFRNFLDLLNSFCDLKKVFLFVLMFLKHVVTPSPNYSVNTSPTPRLIDNFEWNKSCCKFK